MLHVGSVRLFSILVLMSLIFGASAQAAMILPTTPMPTAHPSFANHSTPAVALVPVVAPTVAVPQVKSYHEWKNTMISEAEGRVNTVKESLLRNKATGLNATEAGLNTTLRNMLDKEELQFSLAQDLTITDYFVGYLAKQKSLSAAIKDVSGRLSPEEVAELMAAYANNFFSSRPAAAAGPSGVNSRMDSGL